MSLATNIDQISQQVLEKVPQQTPFRFIDRILEVSDEHIIGSYTFRELGNGRL